MKKVDEHVISILADNKMGVLTRIITGVRREGCNIKSITAARTTDAAYSRITMNVECYDYLIKDVVDRIRALNCVISLTRFEEGDFVEREYAIFSIRDTCEESQAVVKKFKARNVKDCVYEISGDRHTVTECIEALNNISDVEIARTGSIIIKNERGK